MGLEQSRVFTYYPGTLEDSRVGFDFEIAINETGRRGNSFFLDRFDRPVRISLVDASKPLINVPNALLFLPPLPHSRTFSRLIRQDPSKLSIEIRSMLIYGAYEIWWIVMRIIPARVYAWLKSTNTDYLRFLDVPTYRRALEYLEFCGVKFE